MDEKKLDRLAALLRDEARHDADRLADALENLIIAIGMGWDLEGVIQAGQDALTAAGRNPPTELAAIEGRAG